MSCAALLGRSLTVPVHGGALALGGYQGVYLTEMAGGAGEGPQLVATLQVLPSTPAHTRNLEVPIPSRGSHAVDWLQLRKALPALDNLAQDAGAADGALLTFTCKHTSASAALHGGALQPTTMEVLHLPLTSPGGHL